MNAPAERSAYTAELRVLVCANCGAPVDVAVQGGLFHCQYCSAQARVPARAELHASMPIEAPRIPEHERLRRLREQEGLPLLPPPGIAHLFGPGGTFPAWREKDVFARWESARQRTSMQALDAAEELVFLNVVIGNELIRSKEWKRTQSELGGAQ